MAITKSIGKNTLGGGKKMNVNLKTYNRSTHDLSYAWRSSMTVGTLTPFMKILALPGDTFDISLESIVLTHPTIGPLFGSYKLQLDVFTVPFRLYIAALHNNALNVGMNMSQIKIPKIQFENTNEYDIITKDNTYKQINPSAISSYFGTKGVLAGSGATRQINAIPYLGYLDIFKNYYANKQEEDYYALMGDQLILTNATPNLIYQGENQKIISGKITIPTSSVRENMTMKTTLSNGTINEYDLNNSSNFNITISGSDTIYTVATGATMYGTFFQVISGSPLEIKSYKLEEIDNLREYLLSLGMQQAVITTNNTGGSNYLKDILSHGVDNKAYKQSQPLCGLLIKTYQSDIFNNWIQTDWIDGDNGISAITAIDTSDGSFSIDTLNLAKKVYDMLNRIAISGGTYHDWIETVYTAGGVPHAETPIYEGGMSQEIEFQEVVSNSATENEPLGTLAGRGVSRGNNKKGGRLHIKVTEPSYLIGIVSITPRIDYAQGEEWDTFNLNTLDDLHKPALDGIGFQDLQAKTMAWWMGSSISVGKQPAWINYMTNYNKVFGNFAIPNNEMFMCLVKYFTPETNGTNINTENLKISSYIEPKLYNYIFADNSIDAQNFWVQIGVGCQARRVMSAKQIPNL